MMNLAIKEKSMKLIENIDLIQDFQFAINIGYDLYGDDKIKNYIPTTSAIELIEDVMLSMSPTSNDRARIFTGAYGKGKSHLALVLISLLMGQKKELFKDILSIICENKKELCDYITQYLDNNKKMLPVIIQGNGMSIRQTLMQGLRKSLQEAGLEEIMPETYFKSALNTIQNWKSSYPKTYSSFVDKISSNMSEFVNGLQEYNPDCYAEFIGIYPELTSGGEFNPIVNSNVVELYNDVNVEIRKRGFEGIFVIYDEFSKFLEGDLNKVSGEDIKALQDFAENCCRSKEKQIHIMLISHKNILNYIDNLPKQKIDNWKAVSERFKSVELNNSLPQQYELMSRIICHKSKWYEKFKKDNRQKFDKIYEEWGREGIFSGLSTKEYENVVYGCYPLEPITTFLLPAISEKVAQNERTIFTFLSSQNQKHTLYEFLSIENGSFPILTPDYIFDYFEPLFKTEAYNKPTHKHWKSAYAAINKLSESDKLEIKMIKTLALIYIFDHFEKLPPSLDILNSIYNGPLNDMATVTKALRNLTDLGILRKLDNRSWLRIAEHTEINVEDKIKDTIEQRKSVVDIKNILNSFVASQFIYPNAYNDDNEIVRYFDFKFITEEEIRNIKDWEVNLTKASGDGIVYAVISDSHSEHIDFDIYSQIKHKRIMFITPKEQHNIYNNIVRYDAIKNIIERSNDDVLKEELSFSLNDLTDLLNSYIDVYLRPELGKSKYYNNGKELKKIHRRSALSKEISNICTEIFAKSPVINNEVINKNNLSSQAINSRRKVIAGLLENNLQDNLGLVGTGQDISFMRSTVKNTGILNKANNKVYLNIENLKNKELQNVLNTIKDFIIKASGRGGTSFKGLYDTLTIPENGFGLKKGIIPIYLACVLHSYKKYAVIMKGGKEVEIKDELLDGINEKPEDYKIFLENWDVKKEAYATFLKDLFSNYVHEAEKEYNGFEFIVRAMQRWFLQLPKYTKEAGEIYLGNDTNQEIEKHHLRIKNALKLPELNAREFLFDKLPEIYGYKSFDSGIKAKIEHTKTILDNLKSDLIAVLATELKDMFSTNHLNGKATLSSVIKDWVEQFSKEVLSHMFTESENAMLMLCQNINGDNEGFTESFARAATGLRIDDWDSITIKQFINAVKKFKENIENYDNRLKGNKNKPMLGSYKISFVDNKGIERHSTFEKADYSAAAKTLYNDAEAMVLEYGESLSVNEKRQVLIDVIEKVLR